MKRACTILILSMLALPLTTAAQRVTGVSPGQVTVEAGGRGEQIRLKGSDLSRASGARILRGGRAVRGMTARLRVSGSSATVEVAAAANVPAGTGYSLQLTGRSMSRPLTVRVAITVQAAPPPPPPPPPADPDADIQVTSITLSAPQAYAGSTVQAQVHLSAAPAQPFAVEVVSANTNAVASPGQVTVPPGSASYTVDLQALAPQINPGPVVMPIQIQARKVPYTTGPTVNLTVRPTMAISYLRFANNIYDDEAPIVAGTTRGLFVLLSTEPTVGAEYQVTVSGPASAPASVVFDAGNDSEDRAMTLPVTFEDVSAPQSATITLTGEGTSRSKTVTVSPGTNLTSLSASPGTVVGGDVVSVSVGLVGPAPAGGLGVELVSSHPQIMPSQTATVAQGQNSATIAVPTSPTSSATQVTLTVTAGASEMTRTVTVNPPAVTELTLAVGTIQAGSSTTGTVTLSGQVPTPMVLQLSNDGPEVVSVPATVTVPAGAYQATFPVQALPADALASPTASASLTVQSPGGETAQHSVSVTRGGRVSDVAFGVYGAPVAGGSSGSGTVTLDAAAGAGGVDVSLSADAPSLVSVPGTLHVPEGQTSAEFSFGTNDPAENSQVQVTASDGPFTATATLTVWGGVSLESVTVPHQTTNQVPAGGNVNVRMNFNRPIPAGDGVEVALSASSPTVPLPMTFVATEGSVQNRQIQVTAGDVTQDEVVTVSASLDGVSHSATVTILRRSYPTGLNMSATELVSGESADVEVMLDRVSTSATEVSLDAGSAPLQLPPSVTVPVGASSATFQITSTKSPYSGPESAVVTASTPTGSTTESLVLEGSGVDNVLIEPQVSTVGPQTVLNIVVRVGASRDAGPLTVALTSSDPMVVPLPASVIVDPAVGNTTFQITTGSPATSTAVTLTASVMGVEWSAVLTVNPDG